MTWTHVGTAALWAAIGAVAVWLLTWPVRRRSGTWLVASVALTGTAASAGALLGAVHAMLLPMDENVELVSLTLVAGAIAMAIAGVAAVRLGREQRAIAAGLTHLAAGLETASRSRPPRSALERQLVDTATALAESRERTQALEHSRRELISWISHDLRSPLAGLRAMAEALEDDLAADPQPYYKQMVASIDRLSGMVEDLFDLSRVHAGAFGRVAETVDLGDLVSDCVAALEPLSTAKHVGLTGSLRAPARVSGSASELNRALTNVVANAIRHTPDGGEVCVEVGTAPSGAVRITVQDACGGIAPDVLPRVFDVCYRGTRARELGGSDGRAGLGLAITRGIVMAHGGSVGVTNAGAGCRFSVQLPRVEESAES
jgi:signal transduction histidine kinase